MTERRRWWPVLLLAVVLIVPAFVGRRNENTIDEQHPEGRGPVSSFIMTIGGRSGLVAVGEASFRRGSSSRDFSLELGRGNQEGAVVFAADGAGPSAPGRYPVDDDARSGAIHALVITGSTTAPTGVYRAQSGTFTLRAASDSAIEGNFELEARGFRAGSHEQDQQSISVTGSFLATGRSTGSAN